MSLRLALAATAALAFATPVLAQDAPPPPPAAAEAPAAAQEMTPEQAAVLGRIQAAGEALKVMMAEVEPQAAAIRADAALSAEDKEARILALLVPHEATLTEFTTAITDMVAFEAASEGAEPEEVAQAVAMVGPMVRNQINQTLITGEEPEE